jgi:hypothetical protein
MCLSQPTISEKLGFSKTDHTKLHNLLYKEAQLMVFIEYHNSKKEMAEVMGNLGPRRNPWSN